jgi:D-alanyl-D-alanine carboxypeptidase (penicillin-binding protein 5/6)
VRCTNNRTFSLSISAVLLGSILTGCGSTSYEMAYSPDYPVSSYRIAVSEEAVDTAAPFAADLCVVDGDIVADDLDLSRVSSAALFSLSANETILAKNVYEKLAPASLTKIMTALVALKYGSPDEVLTASANVKITESGAQTVGIKEGDQMTLTQALHLLLINSANDAAVMIAEGVGGSIEGFSELMNQEAKEIGATNSNFVNPHGLTADNHYVTAYDMYLIFNAALEYDLINEIISMPSYSTVYKDKNGNDKEISVNTTNLYLQGDKNAPDAITVIGGKTGTTNAAGHCLIILSRDSTGKPYISVILRADDKDILYQDMTDLLSEIKN